jgi:Rap1a immunity proteins
MPQSLSVRPISGNELLAKCEAVPRYAASPNDAAKESTIAAAAGGFCVGFIAGASDMIEAATQNFVCRPADTTPGQIEDLSIAYLHRHPDKGRPRWPNRLGPWRSLPLLIRAPGFCAMVCTAGDREKP